MHQLVSNTDTKSARGELVNAIFQYYRDGNPPTPGIFATDESVYSCGTPANFGDIVVNRSVGDERGIVVGVYGSMLVYIIDRIDPKEPNGQIGDFFAVGVDDAHLVGRSMHPMEDIAAIDAASQ